MANTTDEDAKDERRAEISAIQAKYPQFATSYWDPHVGHVEIPVSTPGALELSVSNFKLDDDLPFLSNFPTVRLTVSFPDGYPSQDAPVFKIQDPWLPETVVQQLKEHGTTIWSKNRTGKPVLVFLDSLLSDDSDYTFNLASKIIEATKHNVTLLLDANRQSKQEKFENEDFDCEVCMDSKKGALCYRISACSHVFCIECLQYFYNDCITRGDIGKVTCMEVSCEIKKNGKSRTIKPSELLRIPLEQEIVDRYIRLRRKKRIESDPTTVYCPVQSCQGPARSKRTIIHDNPDSDTDDSDVDSDAPQPKRFTPDDHSTYPSPAERLATCSECQNSFCIVCKTPWHGDSTDCVPRSKTELTAEERATEEYLKQHSQVCPNCQAPAQKAYGCNHMACYSCQTNYCFLCGVVIDKVAWADHFNTPEEGCYGRLWEHRLGDDQDLPQDNDEGNGGRVAVADAFDWFREMYTIARGPYPNRTWIRVLGPPRHELYRPVDETDSESDAESETERHSRDLAAERRRRRRQHRQRNRQFHEPDRVEAELPNDLTSDDEEAVLAETPSPATARHQGRRHRQREERDAAPRDTLNQVMDQQRTILDAVVEPHLQMRHNLRAHIRWLGERIEESEYELRRALIALIPFNGNYDDVLTQIMTARIARQESDRPHLTNLAQVYGVNGEQEVLQAYSEMMTRVFSDRYAEAEVALARYNIIVHNSIEEALEDDDWLQDDDDEPDVRLEKTVKWRLYNNLQHLGNDEMVLDLVTAIRDHELNGNYPAIIKIIENEQNQRREYEHERTERLQDFFQGIYAEEAERQGREESDEIFELAVLNAGTVCAAAPEPVDLPPRILRDILSRMREDYWRLDGDDARLTILMRDIRVAREGRDRILYLVARGLNPPHMSRQIERAFQEVTEQVYDRNAFETLRERLQGLGQGWDEWVGHRGRPTADYNPVPARDIPGAERRRRDFEVAHLHEREPLEHRPRVIRDFMRGRFPHLDGDDARLWAVMQRMRNIAEEDQREDLEAYQLYLGREFRVQMEDVYRFNNEMRYGRETYERLRAWYRETIEDWDLGLVWREARDGLVDEEEEDEWEEVEEGEEDEEEEAEEEGGVRLREAGRGENGEE